MVMQIKLLVLLLLLLSIVFPPPPPHHHHCHHISIVFPPPPPPLSPHFYCFPSTGWWWRENNRESGIGNRLFEAIMAGTYCLKRFLKETPVTVKLKNKSKKVMALLRCHGDSDCNRTQIRRNFLLYIIQLW